jgi:hypothetical protein
MTIIIEARKVLFIILKNFLKNKNISEKLDYI